MLFGQFGKREAPFPRNAAPAPHRNGARVLPELTGYHAGAAELVDQVRLRHAPTSHNVDEATREKVHNLSNVRNRCVRETVDMDKNGGANHLQAWRRYRKLTQEELAEAVGTTNTVISMLESGERGLSAKWLRRLAPVLKTSAGFLLDHNPFELDTDVLEIWGNANERQRRQLVDIARTLLDQRTGT